MHRWIVWGLLLLGTLLGAAGCAGPAGRAGVDVVYGAVGNACSVDISYQDLSDTPTLVTQQSLPWHIGFTVPSDKVNGFTLSIFAITSCATGTVTVNVVVNGALYGSSTSSTPNVGASVQTSLF
jgi:hypothetical protein